jgi:hypothetical protein
MTGSVLSSRSEPGEEVRNREQYVIDYSRFSFGFRGEMESEVLREETTMKKALLIAAAVMFVASSVFAVLPPKGYIGLFTDATHSVGDPEFYPNAHNTVCPAPYGTFPCWIWCLPSVNGLQAAEFAVFYPPTIITLATVKNPGITVELGTLPTGISVAFGEGACQMDWVWLYQLNLMNLAPIPIWALPPNYTYPGLPPSPPAMYVAIIPHPGTLPAPAIQFASCLPGYPIEPFRNWTPLYLCYDPGSGPLGVEQTNWGAIKSLF